jgi:hypothetical protein
LYQKNFADLCADEISPFGSGSYRLAYRDAIKVKKCALPGTIKIISITKVYKQIVNTNISQIIMSFYKMKWIVPVVVLLSTFLLISCKDNPSNNKKPRSNCYVQLFDGDHFTDGSIIIKGPGEFSSLENLPGSNKNWNNEADSFKSGKNTTVTFWTETDFTGDSTTYKQGAKIPLVEEPSSMKIKCSE